MAKEAAQSGDHATAAALYSQILQHEPEQWEALGGLIRALIARGELDKAQQVLAQVPAGQANHAEIAAARSALELAEQGQKAMAGAGKLRAASSKTRTITRRASNWRRRCSAAASARPRSTNC